MLSLNDRHQIHLNLVTATDFLGKTYRAYEDLIMADPANCHAHLANHDRDLERVRKCFRCIKTFAISDNYYRSVSGLPPAPYPECQPSQAALEQNTLEYLTSLANFEVGTVLRVMEQPEIMLTLLTHQTHQPLQHQRQLAHSMEHPYCRLNPPRPSTGVTPMNLLGRPCLQYRRKTIQL